MNREIRYRGKSDNSNDIEEIKELIKVNYDKGRTFVSCEICKKWNWRQPNGYLKDMVCRGLLLLLYRENLIELPLTLRRIDNSSRLRTKKPKKVQIDESLLMDILQ